MIGTAAAIIGSAVLGAGATALASSKAAKAAQQAADAQTAASQANIAEQQREFDLIQANNAPARQIGNASLSALGGAFGLDGYGTPSMTGQVASTPVPNAGGISMTGASGGKLSGGMVSDPAGAGPGIGHNGGPSMTGGLIDGQPAAVWDEYLAENPDVAAWAASGHGDPSLANQTPEQAAAYHYMHSGQGEGRALPSVSMTAPSAPTTPAGYNDPTAPNGYTIGPRPEMAPLDVGLDAYQQAPDYNVRLNAGNKALDNIASSMGGVMSGARLKAADRYNQDFATTAYDDWRNYTTGQYNTDRARSDGLYQDDRAYDASRYDTRNNQLLTLAGFGQNANQSNANAAQSFASNVGAQNTAAATAQGNAAINGANAFTSGVNNLLTTGAYLGGKLMTAPQSYYGVNPATDYSTAELQGLY